MRHRAPPVVAAILAGALPFGAEAQSWRFTPSLGVDLTWSDNPGATTDALARSDWITRLSPGLRLDHRGGRATLLVDYRRDQGYAANDSRLDFHANRLTSTLNVELVDQTFFLDGSAFINQLNRSAFDTTVVANAPTGQQNRVETRTATLSPYARGRFGEAAQWQVRLNETYLTTDAQAVGRTDTSQLVGTVRSLAPGARFGWSVDADAMHSKSQGLDAFEDRRVRASLIYAPDPLLHFSLYEGYEATDFPGGRSDRSSTPGVGFEWSPNARTQVAGILEHRFFGTGHYLTMSHRTARLAFQASSRRTTSLLGTTTSNDGPGSLEGLMRDLLIASVPDPIQRAEQARQRLSTLGYAPTAFGAGVFTQRPFLLRSVDGTLAYIGPRDTVTLLASQVDRRALGDAPPGVLDVFSQSVDIRQRTLGVTWIHRLTRLTSLTASVTQLRSRGLEPGSLLSSRNDLATVFATTQLGRTSTGSIGVRRIDFRSTVNANHTENAVFGTFAFRF